MLDSVAMWTRVSRMDCRMSTCCCCVCATATFVTARLAYGFKIGSERDYEQLRRT